MARHSRRRDNLSQYIKPIVALIFLGSLSLSGGNLKLALELCALIVMIGVSLVIIGSVPYFLFQIIESMRFRRESAILTSDNDYTPIETVRQEGFTQELLKQLEWRRFEILVQALLQAEGWIDSRIRAGADGGIDLALRESLDSPVTAIAQCKAWRTYTVGVKPVRELFGVMHAEGVSHACFYTSGHFTSEARIFADGKPIDLIDGNELLFRLNALEKSKCDSILDDITAGDYTTPTCPSCDTKMMRRTSRYGEFWGCRSYPHCKQKFHIGK